MKTLVLQFKRGEVIQIGDIAIERHFTASNKVVIHADESINIQRLDSNIFRSRNNLQKCQHDGDFNSISKDKEIK